MTGNQARIKELESQLSSLLRLVEEMTTEMSLLKARNAFLEEKNAMLEKELLQYRNKKNSSNSSVPPSQDPYRVKRTESLRQSTGRKQGGQPGHEGNCLEQALTPDRTVLHQPCYCSCCGKDLSDVTEEFIGKRQVIDIPPVKPEVTEHRLFGKRCSCGHFTESDYPVEAHSPVCYGNRIQALTAYFHTRQYIPFERLQELYRVIFGLSLSSGTLVRMIQTFAGKASGIYEGIRHQVTVGTTVGADETGTCINGKNGWTWVFQTPQATYIHSDTSRGKKVIDQLFHQGFPQSVLVHDCWKSYFSVPAAGHQICVAHLLRELKYLNKLYPNRQWSADFTSLLHRALDLKRTLTGPEDYTQPQSVQARTKLEEELNTVLLHVIDPKDDKLKTFHERIVNYRDYLFPFLYRQDISPDNNASERAIRTFKVKQKVSGLFRSGEGAKSFAVIRSVIDTTIKNAKNILEVLTLVPCITNDS